MPADHEVKLQFDGKTVKPTIPGVMNVGETVSYSPDAGNIRVAAFKVDFPSGSPFKGVNQITDSSARKLEIGGKFQCRCSMTLADGRVVGWDAVANPESGGVHDVQPD
jgi:hypothetical protein